MSTDEGGTLAKSAEERKGEGADGANEERGIWWFLCLLSLFIPSILFIHVFT